MGLEIFVIGIYLVVKYASITLQVFRFDAIVLRIKCCIGRNTEPFKR